MALPSGVTVRLARWPDDAPAIRALRTDVFIEEQRVSPEDEWDGLDEACVHALALDGAGQPIGTGRLLPEGKIGRMAVLRAWRGRGVGSAVLRLLLDVARRRGLDEVRLASQVHAVPFYERFGFEAFGDVFLDAGIPHRWMRARLPAEASS